MKVEESCKRGLDVPRGGEVAKVEKTSVARWKREEEEEETPFS